MMRKFLVLTIAAMLLIGLSVATIGGNGGNSKKDKKQTSDGKVSDNLNSDNDVLEKFEYATDGTANVTEVQEWNTNEPLQTRGWWAEQLANLDPEDFPTDFVDIAEAEDEFENSARSDELFLPETRGLRVIWAIQKIADKNNLKVPYALAREEEGFNSITAIIACESDEDEPNEGYITLRWRCDIGKYSIGAEGDKISTALGVVQQYVAGN